MDQDHVLTDVFETAVGIVKRRLKSGREPSTTAAEQKLADYAIEEATDLVAQHAAERVRGTATTEHRALREMILDGMRHGFPVATKW